MHNDRTAQNTLGSEQLHERVLLGAGSVTLGVGGEVTQVTDVTVGVLGSTVGLAMGVDWEAPVSILSPTSSREQEGGKNKKRTVGTGRSTAVGVVTKLVDVEGPLGVGVLARHVPRDSRRARLALLLERHGAGDLGVTAKDSHCIQLV